MTSLHRTLSLSASVLAVLAGSACTADESLDTATQAASRPLCDRKPTDPSCVLPHLLPELTAATGILSGNSPHGMATTDLDGDSHADLVVTNLYDNTVSVLRGLGTGEFAPRVTYAVPFPKHVEIADLDRDGKSDVIVSGPGNAVYTLQGNGDGTLQAARELAIGGSIEAMTIADVDGNGYPDLIVTNQSNMNNVMVALNTAGTFGAPKTYPVGQTPTDVIAADFNGDRRLDLVTTNYSSNTFSVLLNKGRSGFAAAVSYNANNTPTAAAAGDLNRDGKLDLVMTSFSLNTVSIRLGNGDGTFQPEIYKGVAQGPWDVVVADVSGDGALDVVTSSWIGTDVSILAGYGDGRFDYSIGYHLPSELRDLAIADFDSDGKIDIAAAVFGGNYIAPLLSSVHSFMLTLGLDGDGGGSIFGGPGVGMLCPGACSATFASGRVVTLSAIADDSSQFVGWGGACAGVSGTSCSVTMDAAKTVTATFQHVVTYALSTHINRINDGWGNISLGPTYSVMTDSVAYFPEGTLLTLTPAPFPGSVFVGWSGACTGTDPCVVTMDAAYDVTATFEQL